MKHLSALLAIVMIFAGLSTPSNAADCNNTCYRGNIGYTGFYPSECGLGSDEIETVWMFQARDAVRSAPIVDETNIYFGSNGDKFYCLEKFTGKKVWDFTPGETCKDDKGKNMSGVGSSPALVDGKLFFGSTCGKVYCLDAKTGSKIWAYDSRSMAFASAAIYYNNSILITNADENVYCIDAANGSLKYKIPCKGNYLSPPVIDNGKAYIPYVDGIICYDLERKTELNKGKMQASSLLLTGFPAISSGKVYYGSIFSELYCFDTATGNTSWKNLFMVTTFPCVTDNAIYVGTILNGLACLSLGGSIKWETQIEGVFLGSPVACGDRIYFGVENDFYCYSNTGKKIFKMDVGNMIVNTIVISNNNIYFGTDGGRVYCLGAKNAKPKPSKIILTPEANKVSIGMPVKIRADVFDSKNGKMDDVQITWTVEPKDMGTMSEDGIFTAGKKTGKVTITGCVGSICDSAEIEIADISDFISRITVDPSKTTATVDVPIYFTAKAFDKKGKESSFSDFKWSVDPKTAGKMEQNGAFTPSETGECTITASIGKVSGTATVKVLKVASIAIDPTSTLVNFEKTQQFTVTVLDNTGAPFENPDLKWTCDPPTLGTIDKTGLFTAGTIEQDGKVIVSGYGLTAEAAVRVEEVRQAIISVESPDMVFDQIDPGKSASSKVVIKNDGNIPDTLKITTDSDWILLSPKQVTVDPKSKAEITVMLKTAVLKKGAELVGKITIQGTKPEPVVVNVKVAVNPGVNCFSANDSLDFGKVARGTSKTLTLSIGFNGNQAGRIVPNVPWITVTPNTFSNVRSIDVSVTIAGSTLPAGEAFEGLIEIVGADSCRDTKVKITVQTDKDIMIKLTLGSKLAEINGFEITLNAPPQKIKGTTMVPLRFIGEAFGCKVDWDAKEKKISITRGLKIIVLYMDKKEALVNGQKVPMSAPPTSIKGNTMVPVRFIAETFGANVNFDAGTGVITIIWSPQ